MGVYLLKREGIMPQISLYIDAETLKEVETAANSANLSISKFVSRVIKKSLKSEWPENFFQLFGSIHDDSFSVPDAPEFPADLPRELL